MITFWFPWHIAQHMIQNSIYINLNIEIMRRQIYFKHMEREGPPTDERYEVIQVNKIL